MTTILLGAPTAGEVRFMYAIFFEKKTQPKQMHVAGCYDRAKNSPARYEMPLRAAFFSGRLLV